MRLYEIERGDAFFAGLVPFDGALASVVILCFDPPRVLAA